MAWNKDDSMTTVREELTLAGFKPPGRILFFLGKKGPLDGSDDEAVDLQEELWNEPILGLLDKKFDGGFGSPDMPAFLAEDEDCIYFPSQYDGATSVASVPKDISRGLEFGPTYPGG